MRVRHGKQFFERMRIDTVQESSLVCLPVLKPAGVEIKGPAIRVWTAFYLPRRNASLQGRPDIKCQPDSVSCSRTQICAGSAHLPFVPLLIYRLTFDPCAYLAAPAPE
jgi:hypothetical protein